MPKGECRMSNALGSRRRDVDFGSRVDQSRVECEGGPICPAESSGPMNEPATSRQRWERVIEVMDKPLLALAVLTMLLYLLDLQGGLGRAQQIWLGVTLFIDVIFLFDLVLKIYVYGTSYLHTPWFLIDLISCLPLIDALATGVHPIRAVRFVR